MPPRSPEKSRKSRAQDDSPSLSPAHDSTALIYTSEPWATLSFGRPIFGPSIHAGANECGSFAPIIPVGGRGVKALYCFHKNIDDSKCEVVHTSRPDSALTIRP